MDDKKKEQKKEKFSVKDIVSNRQYRSIAILIFYVILFAILIAILRVPSNSSGENGTTVSNLDGYELIDNKNFNYKYTVTIDDDIYYYEGKKYDNKEMVTLKKGEEQEEYYFVDKEIYVKQEDRYVLTEVKPYILFDFFNTDTLDMLILNGTLVDEANNEYKIDNQGISDVLSSHSVKVDSGDNFATLTYRNSYITGIKFDLSSYAKLMRENYNNIIIDMQFYDFNLVDDFNEPIIN